MTNASFVPTTAVSRGFTACAATDEGTKRESKTAERAIRVVMPGLYERAARPVCKTGRAALRPPCRAPVPQLSVGWLCPPQEHKARCDQGKAENQSDPEREARERQGLARSCELD